MGGDGSQLARCRVPELEGIVISSGFWGAVSRQWLHWRLLELKYGLVLTFGQVLREQSEIDYSLQWLRLKSWVWAALVRLIWSQSLLSQLCPVLLSSLRTQGCAGCLCEV